MIHRKARSLMSTGEAMARVAATALSQAASQQTRPTGSTVTHNADGTKTITGSVLGTDATGTSVTTATHVGDTTPPGVPTGITAWSGDGSVHVSWDGTLEGGIPADFHCVNLLVGGVAFASLNSAGSATYNGASVGTTVKVTATAEDDACAIDGTAAHNVSSACAAISVTVTDTAATTAQHFWADDSGVHVSSTGDHDASGFHQLMTSVKNAFMHGSTELMTISESLIELGKNSTSATIRFCGGLASIAARTVTWLDKSTHLVTDIHSQYGAGLSCDTNGTAAGEPFKAYMGVQTNTGFTDDTYGVCGMAGGKLLLTDPSITDGDATVGVPMKTLISVLSAAYGVPLARLATAIQPVVLFDKWDNAINAGCTLSETAAHFVRLLIEFKTDDGHKNSVMVTPVTGATSVDGQVLDISCSVYNPANGMFIKSKAVQISGTTIGTYNNSGYWTGIWGLSLGNVLGDYITIVKVTGWR